MIKSGNTSIYTEKKKNKHFFFPLKHLKHFPFSFLGPFKTLPLYIDLHENSIYFLLLYLDLFHSLEFLYSRPAIVQKNFKLFLHFYTNIIAFVSCF